MIKVIYIFLSFFLYISSFFKDRNLYKINLVLVFLFFSSAYCLNYDWINYRYFYEKILSGDIIESVIHSGFEPGFVIVSYLCKTLDLDYQWVMVFLNIIIFSFFNSAVKKFDNKNLALFVFFSFFGFFLIAEQIRQAVALSIGFKALDCYINEKKLRAYFLVIVASLFHVSAVFLIVLMLLHKMLYRKNRPFFTIMVLISGTLAPLGFSLILQNSAMFSFYPLLAKKLAYYNNQDLGNDSGLLTLGLLPNLALVILIGLYAVKNYGRRYSQQALIASAFIIQSKIISLFYRFSHYGIINILFCFDEVFKDKKPLNFYRCLVVTVVFSFALKPLSTELYRSSLFDYHFYWVTSQNENSMKKNRCDTLYKVYPTSTYTLGTCS